MFIPAKINLKSDTDNSILHEQTQCNKSYHKSTINQCQGSLKPPLKGFFSHYHRLLIYYQLRELNDNGLQRHFSELGLGLNDPDSQQVRVDQRDGSQDGYYGISFKSFQFLWFIDMQNRACEAVINQMKDI